MVRNLGRAAMLIGCALPWLVVAGSRQDDPRGWSAAQWSTWRDGQIQKILTPTFEAGGERVLLRADVISKASSAYRFIEPMLVDPQFLADSDRAQALSNFVRFAKAQHWMARADSSLGMDVPNAEYWSYAAPYVRLPELLASQAFLKLMSDPSGYKSAVEMVDANNASLPEDQRWLVLPFRAQFIKSVDRTTYGRLLVVVPNVRLPDGKLLDRWVAFAAATPDLKPVPREQSVSVVSVLRDPSTPGQCKAFFADYLREADPSTGQIAPKPAFLLNPSPSKNCYECHKSAVIPIMPKAVYRFGAGGELVPDSSGPTGATEAINSLIAKYGRADFGHLDPDADGPSIGPTTVSDDMLQSGAEAPHSKALRANRSDAFIAEATKDSPIPASSYDNVRANMNCSKCHEGFAKINYFLAVRSDVDSKAYEAKQGLLRTFIEKGCMPPGNTLSAPERHALWECLTKEYLDLDKGRGEFVDWLKGKRE